MAVIEEKNERVFMAFYRLQTCSVSSMRGLPAIGPLPILMTIRGSRLPPVRQGSAIVAVIFRMQRSPHSWLTPQILSSISHQYDAGRNFHAGGRPFNVPATRNEPAHHVF